MIKNFNQMYFFITQTTYKQNKNKNKSEKIAHFITGGEYKYKFDF